MNRNWLFLCYNAGAEMKRNIGKNKNYPLVTVITPTYNRASFLEETILSVLSQNYPNLEYIVLDDGSTDNSVKVIEKYKDKIIWESHKNTGEVQTVNKGFSMAHGEIIGVVNSDDPLLPGAIREIVKYMKENPKIIVTYSDWMEIDEEGRSVKKVITKDYDYEYMLRTHNCPLGASAFFRKKILDKLKGRDESFRYVSDFDFWLRAGFLGQFARIPKILATSRAHPEQTTITGRGYKMAMEHIRVLNKVFALPNLPADIKKLKAQAYSSACEAVRISRGNAFSMKVLSFLISIYYMRSLYIKMLIQFRLNKLRNFNKSS